MQEQKFAPEDLMEAVNVAKVRVVFPRLRQAGLVRWVDDVVGDVLESAWKSRLAFDPEKGELQHWVNRIAHRRAVDRIAVESRKNGDLLPQDSGDSQHLEERLASVAESAGQGVPDVAESVVERVAIASWLRPVMAATAAVMDSQSFIYGFLTHVRFDCDVKAAAEAFGTSEARVREYKRQVELHAQVIVRAWKKRREVAPSEVRVSDLVECLPGPGVAGSWTRDMAEAVVSWPGRLDDVPVDHVMEKTGWTHNTARQHLALTKTLLRIALGVLTATVGKEQ